MSERICFELQLRPEHVEEYTRRHREVWPEMRDALSASGWRNYSLYLTPTNRVIGYLECDDFAAAQRAMSELEVNERWQKEMAPFFAGGEGGTAETKMVVLPEIFHLD